MSIHSAALGLATQNSEGEIIEVFYPRPVLSPTEKAIEIMLGVTQQQKMQNGYAEISPDNASSLTAALAAAGKKNGQEYFVTAATATRFCCCA